MSSWRCELIACSIMELDVGAPLREANWFHVIHAAHAKSALHNVCWQSKILLPVCHQGNAAKMTTETNDRQCKVGSHRLQNSQRLVSPRNPASHLISHKADVTVGWTYRDKIQCDIIYSGIDEKFGWEAVILCFSSEPRATVYEYKNRRVGFLAGYKSNASTDVDP